ncbi:IS3 family transposase [Planomicrobium okeanokoites]|uniref:IS3 family transposase n=1 Tax=Planomicrobium okeanokoites TaxID=244 RepID=UPI0024919217|nr:IS3 family transposase [Planomicrobium okeanokoites]
MTNYNIKSEEFQYIKFNSLNNLQVVEKVDEYIPYYKEEEILKKLGYLTPKEFGAQAD